MVQFELDSFYVKFMNLLQAEKDATLTLKSEAGRAVITLSDDLGPVLSEAGHQQHRPQNGPSRRRRREKHAAARQEEKAAEEASISAAKALEALKLTEKVEKVEKVDASTIQQMQLRKLLKLVIL